MLDFLGCKDITKGEWKLHEFEEDANKVAKTEAKTKKAEEARLAARRKLKKRRKRRKLVSRRKKKRKKEGSSFEEEKSSGGKALGKKAEGKPA